MKKKLVVLLLTAAMCGSMLTGCGNSSDTSSGVTGPADSTAIDSSSEDAVSDATEDKVGGIMYQSGLPIVDEGAYSFSIFVDDSTSTGEFCMLTAFQEQTNVDVELKYYPYETAKERLNLDLNSGDYADVIGGWTLSDSMILQYGVDQGVFIPLEDYFAEYCPNISAILDLPGVREKMTAPDGHIYTIPYVCDDTTVSFSPYINGRWLENVEMSMPTTTEEFEAVLKAFKEQDANGNGNANDEIPFSTDPNNKSLESLAGWFGMPMNKQGLAMIDGEVVYGGTSTAYREFLSWFNSLYEQGLIDTEIFTQDSSTWEGKGNKDLYGVSIAYGSNEFSGIAQKPEKSEFDVLPVLNTENGGIWLRATNGYSVYRTQAVVTDNAKNPEIICRWFDNAFELENGIGCNRGPIDVVVFKEGDGYRAIDTEATMSSEDAEKVSWGNLWPQALPKYVPSGFKYIEDNPLYDEKKAVEATYEPNLTKEPISSFWVDQDDVEVYSEIYTAVLDYYVQQQALFISGEIDVDDDAQWQSYINGLKALGLEEWLQMRGAVIAE